MEEDALGSLRRTHGCAEIGPGLDGAEATVMGWVGGVRGHGAISFLTVCDRTGQAQVVAKAGACDDAVRGRVSRLRAHSSVAVTGTVRAAPKSPSGAELVPSRLLVFSAAQGTPPFEPQAVTVRNIETRLEARHIDMRRRPVADMFGARGAVLRAVRGYFYAEGFEEVDTPKIIATATEGGAALFPVFYYDKQAFLAQSPQLYKEQLVMGLDRVFEIGHIFRAEQSRTPRHLAEAVSIDLEEAYVDYTDVMRRVGGIVSAAAGAASRYAAEAGASLSVAAAPAEIPRRSYGELLDRARAAGSRAEWGDDLRPADLRAAGAEGFYFITDWPAGPKPFYVKASGDASESFDLMFGDLEVSSGSTRISSRAELEGRMRGKGMRPEAFAHHLGAFDYGMPPHAGCGIGLERLMMALTGAANVREASFYPRDADRLVP